ncbi:MAG: MBL fold metallo-hydrolase [bacterium]
MPTSTFTILGSSAGMPQAHRASSGYALTVDGGISIIDCGGGVCSSFLRHGFKPQDIERVFISHTHSDHVCELPLLIQMIHLTGQPESLDVYVPAEFTAPLTLYLNACYLIDEKLNVKVNIIGYENGFVFSDGFRLTAIGNRHLSGNAEIIECLKLPNRMQCHSFLIEVGGKSLFYSADLLTFDDVRSHLDGKDYVLLEPTHIDIDEFFEFAPTVNVGQYVLIHLDTPEAVAQLELRAKKAGLDNLAMAEDGMVLEL